MKIQATYTFNKTAKTVTFTGSTIPASLDKILAVINTTSNVVIYIPTSSATGGTYSSPVLTLTYDTTAMADTDKLLVYIEDGNTYNSVLATAGEAHIGQVGGTTTCTEVDLTLLSPTTTAYTLGDAIGATFTIANASRISGGTGILQSIELIYTIPSTAYRNQAVTATSATPCVFTLTSHTLVNGNKIRMGATGTPPTGFSAGIDYYVINAAANTFQLSLTVGGLALASSSTGTSVTITTYTSQLETALLVTNATLGAVLDNDAFYPTETQSQTEICTIPLTQQAGITDYRETKAYARNLAIPYKTVGGTSLFGLFLFTLPGVSTTTLPAGAKIRARINMLLD